MAPKIKSHLFCLFVYIICYMDLVHSTGTFKQCNDGLVHYIKIKYILNFHSHVNHRLGWGACRVGRCICRLYISSKWGGGGIKILCRPQFHGINVTNIFDSNIRFGFPIELQSVKI